MKKQYLAPAVRVMDLHMDTSFCLSDTLSGGLEKTYDDYIDED